MEFFVFLLWILLAVLVASLGKKRKIGFGMALFLSLIFSPLIGLIIVMLSDELKDGAVNQIPRYREYLDKAEREHFKGNNSVALDNYLDAIFYLEKDYSKLNEKDEANRQKLLTDLKSKVDKLKSESTII